MTQEASTFEQFSDCEKFSNRVSDSDESGLNNKYPTMTLYCTTLVPATDTKNP